MSGSFRTWLVALAPAVVLAATALPALPASAAVEATPVGPNQFFTGLVNNVAGSATIRVTCSGTVHPGQTGHPVAGQTVQVQPAAGPTSADVGFTGSAGTSISETLGASEPTVIPFAVNT